MKPAVKLSTAIRRFLGEHPGEAFCARCLAVKITGRPTIASSAISELEGLGVRRVYERCSGCGQRRLVAAIGG